MPIMVGGDDSVIWKIRVKKVKHAASDPDFSGTPKIFYHEAVEENDADDLFKITIRLPEGVIWPPASAATFLSAQAQEKNGRTYVTFWLPIEPHNGQPDREPAAVLKKDPDQIEIDWAKKT